jgi:hypothetical protein
MKPSPELDDPQTVPSLEIVFEETKRSLEDQARLWDNLSDNSRFVLTAASLLAAGLAAFPLSSDSKPLEGWLVTPALIVYLWLAWCSLQGFRIRPFSTSSEPLGLREYLKEEPEFTRRRVVAAMVQVFENNRHHLSQKACWVNRSQQLLVIEASWLVVMSVVRLWR